MHTYYERAGVCVTGEYLTVGSRRYEIVDLRDVWASRGSRAPVGMGTIVAAMVAFAILVGGSYYGHSALVTTLGVASLVTVWLLVVSKKSRHRHYELWVKYHGTEIRVLAVADSETFGQICRAVVRARESRAASMAARWHGVPRQSRSLRGAANGAVPLICGPKSR